MKESATTREAVLRIVQTITGYRDPNAALVEKLEVDPHHIRALAEALLQQRGESVEREEDVA